MTVEVRFRTRLRIKAFKRGAENRGLTLTTKKKKKKKEKSDNNCKALACSWYGKENELNNGEVITPLTELVKRLIPNIVRMSKCGLRTEIEVGINV